MDETGGAGLRGNSKDFKIIREGVAKEINWYRNNIDQSAEVLHLSAKDIENDYPNANKTGAWDGTGNGKSGYYRMVDDVDSKGNAIRVPVLINNGWQLDGENLTNIIDYESTALKDPNQTSTGGGSLDPIDENK
jgi:hypothetical protein